MVTLATEKLQELRVITNDRLNRNRIKHNFKVNDYVFVLDRLQVPGSTRPLKSKFHPSPYVVVKTYATTTLVRRLADGFQSCYHNDDLKKYDATSPLFKDLPPQVSKVLLHDFKNLLNADLCTLAKYDALGIPDGLELFNPEAVKNLNADDTDENEINVEIMDENSINLFENQKDPLHVQDEFEPEIKISKWDEINRALAKNKDIPSIPDTVGLTPEVNLPDEQNLTLIQPSSNMMEQIDDLQDLQINQDNESKNNESESDEELPELTPDITDIELTNVPNTNTRTLRSNTQALQQAQEYKLQKPIKRVRFQ
jgi:hypothetical protein